MLEVNFELFLYSKDLIFHNVVQHWCLLEYDFYIWWRLRKLNLSIKNWSSDVKKHIWLSWRIVLTSIYFFIVMRFELTVGVDRMSKTILQSFESQFIIFTHSWRPKNRCSNVKIPCFWWSIKYICFILMSQAIV